MMLREEPLTGRRWGLALGLVVLAHGGLIAYLRQAVAPLPEPVEKPAVLIDLEPLPLAHVANLPSATEAQLPEQPVETQPVETQPVETLSPPDETPPPPDETPPPPDETPPPPDDTPPPVETPLPPVATASPALVSEPQIAEASAPVLQPVKTMPQPEAVKPMADLPKPPAPRHRAPHPHDVERTAAPATSPPAASPAPAAAPSAAPSDILSWQSRLLAHLNRFKRFPPEAQMRQRQGTALIHVTLMPNGSAEGVRLQRGSGTDSLDQEAVALIARAVPLPVPDSSTGAIEIEVPIVFTIK